MNFKDLESALGHVTKNAEADSVFGQELIDFTKDPRNGSAEFLSALLKLGGDLFTGNINLKKYPFIIVESIRRIQDSLQKINDTIKTLPKAVKKNVKEDLRIAKDLRDLLNAHEEDEEEIPEEVWNRILEIIAELEGGNPALSEAPAQVKSAWARAQGHLDWKVLPLVFLGGCLTSEGCTYVEEETGKNPITWVYDEIDARLED